MVPHAQSGDPVSREVTDVGLVGSKARIELVADARGVNRGVEDARRTLRGFEREQAAMFSAAEREAKRAGKVFADMYKRQHSDARQFNASMGRTDLKSTTFGGFVGGAAGTAAVAAGGVLLDAGKQVLDFERDLLRLRISGEMTAEQMNKLRTRVNAVSSAPGARARTCSASPRRSCARPATRRTPTRSSS